MSPVLSVVIPTYNSARVIGRCLASLAFAAEAGIEIIVVDDGSVDDTIDAISQWDRFAVRLERQANAGPGPARNRGLAMAGGDFVVFLDSDDEVSEAWHAFFVRLRVAPRDTGLATCGLVSRDPSGAMRVRSPKRLSMAFGGVTGLFLPGAYAIRRRLLTQIGGFSPHVSYGEHHELAIRLGPALSALPCLSTHEALVLKHHDRSPGRVRDYAEARLASSQYVLRQHAGALRHDRRMRANYHAVASYAAYSLGDRRTATRHSMASIAVQPLRAKHWARLVRSAVPVSRLGKIEPGEEET